ncbi:LptA/OstA family protein [Nitrospina sp. Nb-3]|uniref:LptA/OstA family protein n=1 Tax=Nitrospina sp. Nb-3 TaxID=2940485 RepID=UPI0032C4A8B3
MNFYFKKNFYSLASVTIGLLLIAVGSSWAQEGSPNKEAPKRLEITSEKMRTEDNGRKIIFIGNVRGTWEDVVLTSKILEVYTKPRDHTQSGSSPGAEDPGQGQELEKIIALENVDVVKGTKKARGDKAVYFDKDQKMILTGTPHATAWENENILEGPEMIFYMNEDRFEVTNGVKLILFPKDSELKKVDKKN